MTPFEKAFDVVAAKKQGQLTLATVSCAIELISEMLEERADDDEAHRQEVELLRDENKLLHARLDLIKRYADLSNEQGRV